jgi:hypothetical protein
MTYSGHVAVESGFIRKSQKKRPLRYAKGRSEYRPQKLKMMLDATLFHNGVGHVVAWYFGINR